MTILFPRDEIMGDALAGGIVAMIMAFIVFFLILAVALYIYMSLAFTALAKKAKVGPAEIAWIPVVGPAILISKVAKMHWWPILLLVGFWIPLLSLVFTIFFIIWLWKTYEVVKKPGWWAILWIIPLVGWIMLGVAAWSKK